MKNENQNCSYFVAVISEIGKEALMTGGIKRPVIKAKCFDTNEKIAEISIVFSSISQIRKSVAYEVGDVIYFSAYIGECPADNIVFYPRTVHLLKKCQMEEETMSDSFIKSRLVPFMKEPNRVIFEGRVCVTDGKNSSLLVTNQEMMRGECREESHIWVKHPWVNIQKEDQVLFMDEEKEEGLSGCVYKKDFFE